MKEALKLGKVVQVGRKVNVLNRTVNNFAAEFLDQGQSEESWKRFEQQEEAFRYELAGRKKCGNTFICKGDYKPWHKLIKLLQSVFFKSNGNFQEYRTKTGHCWNDDFIKFCNRVINCFPVQKCVNYSSKAGLKDCLIVIKDVIQPQLSYLLNNCTDENQGIEISWANLFDQLFFGQSFYAN